MVAEDREPRRLAYGRLLGSIWSSAYYWTPSRSITTYAPTTHQARRRWPASGWTS
jgi:hypothetical protein